VCIGVLHVVGRLAPIAVCVSSSVVDAQPRAAYVPLVFAYIQDNSYDLYGLAILHNRNFVSLGPVILLMRLIADVLLMYNVEKGN